MINRKIRCLVQGCPMLKDCKNDPKASLRRCPMKRWDMDILLETKAERRDTTAEQRYRRMAGDV